MEFAQQAVGNYTKMKAFGLAIELQLKMSHLYLWLGKNVEALDMLMTTYEQVNDFSHVGKVTSAHQLITGQRRVSDCNALSVNALHAKICILHSRSSSGVSQDGKQFHCSFSLANDHQILSTGKSG